MREDHDFHGKDHGFNGPAAALRLRLMPERAAFDLDSRTLFVADVHLGKAAVFRARGVPVPRGTTTATLARLSQALTRTRATRLVVLGDFLHAHESHADGTMAALAAWRQRHASLDCVVVEGNHDRHAGPVQAAFDIRTVPAHEQPGLRGVHEPEEAPAPSEVGTLLTLAGHVHPVVRLKGRHDSLRLPCFWLRGNVMTLPAFGDFTGGFLVRPHSRSRAESLARQRFFMVADAVLPLPPD